MPNKWPNRSKELKAAVAELHRKARGLAFQASPKTPAYISQVNVILGALVEAPPSLLKHLATECSKYVETKRKLASTKCRDRLLLDLAGLDDENATRKARRFEKQVLENMYYWFAKPDGALRLWTSKVAEIEAVFRRVDERTVVPTTAARRRRAEALFRAGLRAMGLPAKAADNALNFKIKREIRRSKKS